MITKAVQNLLEVANLLDPANYLYTTEDVSLFAILYLWILELTYEFNLWKYCLFREIRAIILF